MGSNKENQRPKSSETIRNPRFTEFDTQKERNIQHPNHQNKPTHP